MTRYRLLMKPELLQQLAALSRAAKTQPGGLRDREFRALKAGLRAIASGDEDSYDGKRLGYSSNHHDLRDCAEIKLPVVTETRHNYQLGPSHRLIYREFEAEDGGPPYREAISFAHRGNNRPFNEAAARLSRETGVRHQSLNALPDTRPQLGPRSPDEAAPIRQPLPPDLRKALAAASDVALARGAVTGQQTPQTPATSRHRPERPARGR